MLAPQQDLREKLETELSTRHVDQVVTDLINRIERLPGNSGSIHKTRRVSANLNSLLINNLRKEVPIENPTFGELACIEEKLHKQFIDWIIESQRIGVRP